MADYKVGMIGLGVMGKNLALNIADKGFAVAGWDAWADQVDKFDSESAGSPIKGFRDLEEFIRSLERPRRVVLLVKAGQVVDDTIAKIAPLLDEGDLIVDGGNEFFENTERRARELDARGLRFFGMGVSGGSEGARLGPSMMPGGDEAAYSELAPVLEKVAAQVEDGPCVTYIGPGGAGHYVKMVHNGIEYGDMQLIAEAYDVLKNIGGLSNAELAETFDEWNRGELESFLIEITAKIFTRKDDESDADLLDVIVDSASMKGTGSWTVQDAARLAVPVPTIAAAVDARVLSGMREDRLKVAKVLRGPSPSKTERTELVSDVRAALYAAKCVSYAQGMHLIRKASDDRSWGVNLGELARIWKAGCIIRAGFLGRIQEAFGRNPQLLNLLIDPSFAEELAVRQAAWRRVVSLAQGSGIAVPATAGSLAYYDALRRQRLPANMIQAQRDFFGSHTYERLDKSGTFHTEWEK